MFKTIKKKFKRFSLYINLFQKSLKNICLKQLVLIITTLHKRYDVNTHIHWIYTYLRSRFIYILHILYIPTQYNSNNTKQKCIKFLQS